MREKRTEQEKREADKFWERYKELAEKDTEILSKTDIKQSTLSTWRSEHRFPGADDAVKIANTLKKSVEWLVTGKEDAALKDDEQNLLETYNLLSDTGKEAAIGAVRGLVSYFPQLSEQAGESTGMAT